MSQLHVLVTEAHSIVALSVGAVVVHCVASENPKVLDHLEELSSHVGDVGAFVYRR